MTKFTFDTSTSLFMIANESSYVDFYNSVGQDLTAFGIATESTGVMDTLKRFWTMVKTFFKKLVDSIIKFFRIIFGNTTRIVHAAGTNLIKQRASVWANDIAKAESLNIGLDTNLQASFSETMDRLKAEAMQTYKDVLTTVSNNVKASAYVNAKDTEFSSIHQIANRLNRITLKLEKLSYAAANDPNVYASTLAECQRITSKICATASAMVKILADTIVLVGYDSRKGFGGGFDVEIIDT